MTPPGRTVFADENPRVHRDHGRRAATCDARQGSIVQKIYLEQVPSLGLFVQPAVLKQLVDGIVDGL